MPDGESGKTEMNKKIIDDIVAESRSAEFDHGQYHSGHEGYAVIAEEFDELWELVKVRNESRDLLAMYKEAIQVASTAARFAEMVNGWIENGGGR
jgi:hypothetical protein